MTKYKFIWENGEETVDFPTKNVKIACRQIKTSPMNIATGMLVQVDIIHSKDNIEEKWWDSEMFWKNLKLCNQEAAQTRKKKGGKG